MKKLTALLIAVLMAGAFSVSASAHGCCSKKTAKKTRPAYCASCFIDENEDGICDNCGKTCAFIDKNNDGVCDNCRFTDENNDGICDNPHYRNNSARRAGQHKSCRGRCR